MGSSVTVNESVEAAIRAELEQMPHVSATTIAAAALKTAQAIDRKTTSLLVEALAKLMVQLKAVEAPKREVSELDRLRADRAKRRA